MSKKKAGVFWALVMLLALPAVGQTQPQTYFLVMNQPVGQGTVIPTPGTYPLTEGTQVTLQASPAQGWRFDKWVINGSEVTIDTYSFEITENTTVTAYFVRQYTLTMAVSPVGGGTTTPLVGTYFYDADTVVNISALASAGYRFDNWTGGVTDPNSATTTIVMDGDKTVTANFVRQYTLTIEVNPAGGGTTTPAVGTHVYDAGTVVNISAIASAGYRFGNWTGGVTNPNSATTTIVMDGDKTVTANFVRQYTLTMAVNPAGGGTTTPAVGTHVYDAGTVVSISATPAGGFAFGKWIGDVQDPNDPSTVVTVNEDKVVTAIFVRTEQRSFGPGWNLLSVPLLPLAPNNTPAAVFGDDVSPLWIYWWNPNKTPAGYETPTDVDPGRGYWVYLMGQTVIDVTGTVVEQDYEVPLGNAGWHMISTPTINVYWGYCKFTDGTTTKTYRDAVEAGWIAPYAFRWDPAANQYIPLLDNGVIEPWVGYWIRTYVDGLTLILPVYEAIHNPPSPPTPSILVPTAAELGLTPPPPPTVTLSADLVLAYPNPVSTGHGVTFRVLALPVEELRVTVLDVSGRLVWTAATLGNQLSWNLVDSAGRTVANGVYLYFVEVKATGQWMRSGLQKLLILR